MLLVEVLVVFACILGKGEEEGGGEVREEPSKARGASEKFTKLHVDVVSFLYSNNNEGGLSPFDGSQSNYQL